MIHWCENQLEFMSLSACLPVSLPASVCLSVCVLSRHLSSADLCINIIILIKVNKCYYESESVDPISQSELMENSQQPFPSLTRCLSASLSLSLISHYHVSGFSEETPTPSPPPSSRNTVMLLPGCTVMWPVWMRARQKSCPKRRPHPHPEQLFGLPSVFTL